MREREERQSIQHVVHVQRAPFPTTVNVEGVIQTLEPHPTILRPKFSITLKGSNTVNKRPILRNGFPFLLPNHGG